jgi:hypothetical protein
LIRNRAYLQAKARRSDIREYGGHLSHEEEIVAEETAEQSAESTIDKIEGERGRLMHSVASQSFDTLERRVAWVLNHYSEARDSDVALAIRYWEVFDAEYFDGRALNPSNLFKLTRTTSLTRARAKIQNVYRLYQASPLVRKHRGKLSEEEKAKAIDDTTSFPVLSVYADEAGKTDTYVIVGSLWIFDGLETLRMTNLIGAYKDSNGISGEMHFKDVTGRDVDKYKGLIDLVIENGSALSFKVISMNRSGAGQMQTILDKLYYLLFKRGVEHEDSTGRTPLPRRIQVLKDLETEDADRLLLAGIKDQLSAASAAEFDGKLYLDDFQAVDSKSVNLLQVADLVAASVSRVYNHPTDTPSSPKDLVAHHVLERLGIPKSPNSGDVFTDVAVKLSI